MPKNFICINQLSVHLKKFSFIFVILEIFFRDLKRFYLFSGIIFELKINFWKPENIKIPHFSRSLTLHINTCRHSPSRADRKSTNLVSSRHSVCPRSNAEVPPANLRRGVSTPPASSAKIVAIRGSFRSPLHLHIIIFTNLCTRSLFPFLCSLTLARSSVVGLRFYFSGQLDHAAPYTASR